MKQEIKNVAVGDRFTRLLVLSLIPDSKNPKASCICDCGKKVTPQRGALKNGRAKSCGCLRKELLANPWVNRQKLDPVESKRRNTESINVWHRANPEKNRAASKKFYRLNKERVKSYHHARRATINGAIGKPSQGVEKNLLKLQKWKCACCKTCLKTTKHHIDHVIALSRGGENSDRNLQILCATCNLQKGAKHPIDFMQSKGFLL